MSPTMSEASAGSAARVLARLPLWVKLPIIFGAIAVCVAIGLAINQEDKKPAIGSGTVGGVLLIFGLVIWLYKYNPSDNLSEEGVAVTPTHIHMQMPYQYTDGSGASDHKSASTRVLRPGQVFGHAGHRRIELAGDSSEAGGIAPVLLPRRRHSTPTSSSHGAASAQGSGGSGGSAEVQTHFPFPSPPSLTRTILTRTTSAPSTLPGQQGQLPGQIVRTQARRSLVGMTDTSTEESKDVTATR